MYVYETGLDRQAPCSDVAVIGGNCQIEAVAGKLVGIERILWLCGYILLPTLVLLDPGKSLRGVDMKGNRTTSEEMLGRSGIT